MWLAAMYVMRSDAAQQIHPDPVGREGDIVRECAFREVHAGGATAQQTHPNHRVESVISSEIVSSERCMLVMQQSSRCTQISG